MNKLRFREPIFKPEDGRTICIVDECTDLLDEVSDNCSVATGVVAVAAGATLNTMDGMFPNIKGVAVCHPEDEFDEHVGADVARTKAYKAYHKRMAKDYGKVIAMLQKAIIQMTPLMEKHQENVARLDEKLKKMQNE